MVGSAFLFRQEILANRRELRDARRESREVPFKGGGVDLQGDLEWTSKAIYYGIAFLLYLSLSWYVVPTLLFS